MKLKKDYKQMALAKSPTLAAKEENGEYLIILETKSGVHTVGRGKDEQAAWMAACNYYGIK